MSEIIRLFNAYANGLKSAKAHLEMARSAVNGARRALPPRIVK
jgi:hypothetical protein